MCDIKKLADLISVAAASVLVALILCGIAAINAGTFWGAFANAALMIPAAIAVGVALSTIGLAIASFAPCRSGPCATIAETVFNALVALQIGLTILLAAVLVGVFGASIPFAGVIVAVALAIGCGTAGIAMTVLTRLYLPNLDACRRSSVGTPPTQTPEVTVARILGGIAGAALFLASGAIGIYTIADGPGSSG